MTTNKKRKIVFACSLVSKKHHFDGERRKSTDILRILRGRYRVSVCNFTKIRIFQLAKFFFLVLFHRKRFVFIAKAPSGGNILLKILRLLKYPRSQIAFYLYGKGLLGGYFGSRVNIVNLQYPDTLICESPFIKNDFIKRGFEESRLKVFPCVKRTFDIEIPPFQQKNVLKGIFISRIVKAKGVLDLISALEVVNKSQRKYELVISGGWPEVETEKEVELIAKQRDDVTYLGQTFSLNTIDDYRYLSCFDIHFFPTKFPHEGIPGVAIDAFVAGLPTLTSEYDCAREVFSDKTAFFFAYDDMDDLIEKMEYIYDHQQELYAKRKYCKEEAALYSEEAFDSFIREVIGD